jgi:hypothetical protein
MTNLKLLRYRRYLKRLERHRRPAAPPAKPKRQPKPPLAGGSAVGLMEAIFGRKIAPDPIVASQTTDGWTGAAGVSIAEIEEAKRKVRGV